jgi:hypothetical protein
MKWAGGEPDIVGHDQATGEYIFYDCSAESPKGRRSFCYDREALESRKEDKPKNSAVDMAAATGIENVSINHLVKPSSQRCCIKWLNIIVK